MNTCNIIVDSEKQYGYIPVRVYGPGSYSQLDRDTDYIITLSSYNLYAFDTGYSYFGATLSGIGNYTGKKQLTYTKVTQYLRVQVHVFLDRHLGVARPTDYITGASGYLTNDSTSEYADIKWQSYTGGAPVGDGLEVSNLDNEYYSTFEIKSGYCPGYMYYTTSRPYFKDIFRVTSSKYRINGYWYGQSLDKIGKNYTYVTNDASDKSTLTIDITNISRNTSDRIYSMKQLGIILDVATVS